jgi:ABC-type uncharacterized transport system permease subunit
MGAWAEHVGGSNIEFRVVLPDGAEDLEIAAHRFLQGLSEEHWKLLDKELSARVLAPRGGLHSACINSGDLTKNLAVPLVSETSILLAHHLPIMDVADILINGQVVGSATFELK